MFKFRSKKNKVQVQKQITFEPSLPFLRKVGQYIRDEIVKEAKRQSLADRSQPASYSQRVKVPEGIPKSQKFFDSIQYRIVDGYRIEIYSDWPWINQIVEGRPPYKMEWLTQPKGVKRVAINTSTGVIFRTTPGTLSKAWVHPGFASHDFIQRGWEKATPKVKSMYAQEAFKYIVKEANKK